jgi:PAS domain-containing protein
MMKGNPDNQDHHKDLRSRAMAHFKGPDGQAQAHAHTRADSSAALAVLYNLASTPATAPDALALLHELQVHQVEVDLQDEELRRSRRELEASMQRQAQLFECAPMGYLVLDAHAVVLELNHLAATLLGFAADSLPGRSLETLLVPESVPGLRAMLGRVAPPAPLAFAELLLPAGLAGGTRRTQASACRDPAGSGFLVCLAGGPAITT